MKFTLACVLISIGMTLAVPANASTVYVTPTNDLTAVVDPNLDLPIGSPILSTDAATTPNLLAVAPAANAATSSCAEKTRMSPVYGSFACLVGPSEPLTPVGGVSAGSQPGSPSGAAAAPEANTLALLGSGLLVLWGVSRRRIGRNRL